MKLFASLYLDQDVDVLLARLLQARGFDVTTVRDEDRLGLSDEEQLDYAIQLERCFVTHNRYDFESLHTQYILSNKHHFGIILLHRRDVYELARRLTDALDEFTADEMSDMLLQL